MKRNALLLTCILLSVFFNAIVHSQEVEYQTHGVTHKLPIFYEKLAARMNHSLSWTNGEYDDFATWRKKAKSKVMECIFPAPPGTFFNAKVIDEQDRGTYVARKVILNITDDSRILAFMLVPKSAGPHPAVLVLHDHGGKFDIGKEKVVEPWGEPIERIQSAKDWVKTNYEGVFIGDELAKQGYVVFTTDILNWSDRAGDGYSGQQELASNLLHLGSSFAGLIAHEDLRAAEFISIQPEVDPSRIAAMGLSLGGFRTWQVAALSDHIAAGVSVCWMSTVKGLMTPGNNHTRGQSAFTMLHPGLAQYLDYPDVASIACPKPMMFICGSKDALFPVETINDSFAKMREVWHSQNADKNLVTKLYDAPHEFNLQMQSDAFIWLKKQFQHTENMNE